jgi:hypothetical protein
LHGANDLLRYWLKPGCHGSSTPRHQRPQPKRPVIYSRDLLSCGWLNMSVVGPNAISFPGCMNAVLLDMRAACSMLWVTLTIVNLSISISSSIRAVDPVRMWTRRAEGPQAVRQFRARVRLRGSGPLASNLSLTSSHSVNGSPEDPSVVVTSAKVGCPGRQTPPENYRSDCKRWHWNRTSCAAPRS